MMYSSLVACSQPNPTKWAEHHSRVESHTRAGVWDYNGIRTTFSSRCIHKNLPVTARAWNAVDGEISRNLFIRNTDMFLKKLQCHLTQLNRIWFTFNLDLWPTNLNINRDHQHNKDHLHTNFEISEVMHSGVILCTVWKTNIQPNWQLQSNIYFGRGGGNYNTLHWPFLAVWFKPLHWGFSSAIKNSNWQLALLNTHTPTKVFYHISDQQVVHLLVQLFLNSHKLF